MAKSNRQVYKIPQPKAPKAMQIESAPQTPAPVLPERNELCYAVFFGVLVGGLIADGFLIFYLAQNSMHAWAQNPVNWIQAISFTVCTALSVSLLRAIIWGSFILAAAVAARTQSYTAQNTICQWARRYSYLIPGGASWATQAIIQRHMAREEFDEVIALGSSEYEAVVKKNPKDDSLANLCSFVSAAYQQKNENHKAIEWSEKAVKSFERIFEELTKGKGLKKYAGQSIIETVRLQSAQATAGLAMSYLAVRNKMKAKENFKSALQQLRDCPESPQKRDMTRLCEEYLSQLKHF